LTYQEVNDKHVSLRVKKYPTDPQKSATQNSDDMATKEDLKNYNLGYIATPN